MPPNLYITKVIVILWELYKKQTFLYTHVFWFKIITENRIVTNFTTAIMEDLDVCDI